MTMFHKQKTHPLVQVMQTGFFVSLSSYVVFWLADMYRPGFVSRYVSVHVFLLASILFGTLWSMFMEEYIERFYLHALTILVVGGLSVMLTWNLLEDLGVYQVIFVPIIFITPFIIYRLLRS